MKELLNFSEYNTKIENFLAQKSIYFSILPPVNKKC